MHVCFSPEVWPLWCWLLGGSHHDHLWPSGQKCLEEFQSLEESKEDQLLTAYLQIIKCFLLRINTMIHGLPFYIFLLGTLVTWIDPVNMLLVQRIRNAPSNSQARLQVFSGHEVLWNLKAYNSRVVCAFLASCCVANARANPSSSNLLLAACVPVPQTLAWVTHVIPKVCCSDSFER